MTHSLVEIPQAEWPALRDIYIEQKKFSNSYNTIQCLIEWKAASNEIDIKIYSLGGDWRRDGTYLAIMKEPVNYVFFNTLSDNHERLSIALNKLENEPTLLFGYSKRLLPTVEKYIKNLGVRVEKANATIWFHIDKDKAKQFEVNIPEGYKHQRLELKHAEQVNSVWPHHGPGSIIFVNRLIKFNDSIGVFDKSDNLIAWSLRLPNGSLGLVQVMDTHKRLGFGSLVVKAISKLLAEKELEVTAPVLIDNIPSQKMFSKLGFKPIDEIYWALVPERK
ncbi:uncharacterized protein [Eurosta solidaginis]|uniref:uncharacterized protein n=1 Tax=Eurosta solidaginis TaxID=178769 RepID=UPI003530ABF3